MVDLNTDLLYTSCKLGTVMAETFYEFLNFTAWMVVIYFGFRIIWTVVTIIWLANLTAELIRHREELKLNKNKVPDVVRTRVEFENGIYYLYNVENSEFVVQGKNISNMIENLQNKLKGAEIKIVEGDKDVLLKLKEKQ
jgi:uncharacterized membrane protein